MNDLRSLANSSPARRVVVATTAALAFISLWRAAAIVLSDLASTMFYVGGIAERSIGPPAPWVILAVMVFGYAIRSIYLESCGMFVRGGVYVVVRNSLGPRIAKFSVSALVVDYVLTGPISSVSAGTYLAHLLNELFAYGRLGLRVNPPLFAACFGILVTAYFWRLNIKGIHESSTKALRIMQLTTVMVVLLLIWCPITMVARKDYQLPPLPSLHTIHFSAGSLGWLEGTFWPNLWLVALLIAFGHSLLAMSGFETLAQIYREMAHPKMENLKRTALLVCTYALVSTGLIGLFAAMIIPADLRPRYYDNMIGGLVMHLAGPYPLRLGFHVFVVCVGVLILSAGVNTSLVGSNGVLNRVAEDGVLLNWFRKPHPQFGTTSRIITLVALTQVATIAGSRGDVYLLGEAYAFGVVWSFALKALAVLVLRYHRTDQEYKTPWNLRVRNRELPLGLALITAVLIAVAIVNLFTKKTATLYGMALSGLLMGLFTVSERANMARRKEEKPGLEQFNLVVSDQSATGALAARPGCVLVAVRNFHQLAPLRAALQETDTSKQDIVVMTVRPAGAGEHALRDDQIFSEYEQELFTQVVEIAEKEGKPVHLLVVPSANPLAAIVATAVGLNASLVVTGLSDGAHPEELAQHLGLEWEQLPDPKSSLALEIVSAGGPPFRVILGPHEPELWPEDVELTHRLWLRLAVEKRLRAQLHHRDVVKLALRRLELDLGDPAQRETVMAELEKMLRSPRLDPPKPE